MRLPTPPAGNANITERRGAWRLTIETLDGGYHIIGAADAPSELVLPFDVYGNVALDGPRGGLDWRHFRRTDIGQMKARYVEATA